MSACVRGGRPEQALALYEHMQDENDDDENDAVDVHGEEDTNRGRGSGLVRDNYSYGYDDWFILLYPS